MSQSTRFGRRRYLSSGECPFYCLFALPFPLLSFGYSSVLVASSTGIYLLQFVTKRIVALFWPIFLSLVVNRLVFFWKVLSKSTCMSKFGLCLHNAHVLIHRILILVLVCVFFACMCFLVLCFLVLFCMFFVFAFIYFFICLFHFALCVFWFCFFILRFLVLHFLLFGCAFCVFCMCAF